MSNGKLIVLTEALRYWASYNGINLDGAKITIDISADGGNGHRAKHALVKELADLDCYRSPGYLRNGNIKLLGIEVELYQNRTVVTREKL